jgi:hypothetical protein
MNYPYSHGWPLWPFTRLSPKEMERLLKKIEGQRVDELEEAPW